MKKLFIIIIFALIVKQTWTQEVFNIVVEDTSSHITSSVVALDTGYVLLTGTSNEYGVRSISLRYINLVGEIQWKCIYGSTNVEYWEGFSNCLFQDDHTPSMCVTLIDDINDKYGVSLLLFDSLYHTGQLFTYAYDTLWKKAFNIAKTNEDEFYIIGQNYDYVGEASRLYVVKINSEHQLIWQKSFGSNYEGGSHIIETSDKNILVGGLTYSFPTTTNGEDWYLIKLDTAGNVIWQNGFGKPGYLNYDGAVAGLIETSDSNYIACGGYPAVRSDCDTYWDGCIRKVSKDGDLMWERFYRMFTYYRSDGLMRFYSTLTSIIPDHGSDIMILGSSYGHYPQQRGFLMKTDSIGRIKWCRHYYAIDSLTRGQYLVSMQPTSDNGFILAGYGNDYDTHGYFPSQQAWLVKTDSLGIDDLCYTAPPELNIDVILPETVNCSDTITVYAYIAGKSAPYTIETSIGQVIDSIYYPPLFVPVEIGLSEAEIDCGGNIIYTQQITEATLSNHEWGQCIAKPVEFYTPHTSGSQQINITVTDAYGESKTITKEVFVNECGQSIADAEICSVNLYPNPTKGKIYLDIPTDLIPEKAEVYNSLGQLVKSVNVHSGLNVVDVSDFATGNYIIKINVVDKTYSLNFEKH